MSAVRTDRTDCKCGARVILAPGFPPLDYWPDDSGTVAVRHLATGAWAAEPFLPGDRLKPAGHRHAVHTCKDSTP
jgi:hypothetical protein